MAKYDVEKGFLSKLLETKDLMTIKDSQIKLSYFSGDNKLAFKYIYDTALSTGEVPTIRAFKTRFPSYKLEEYQKDDKVVVGTEENLVYWCRELRTKVKHNTIAEFMEESMKFLQSFKSEEAYAKIKQGISYIENEVVETSDVDITKNTEDRKAAYLKRKENKGMIGLPYGISYLDYITKGLKKETLTTVIANTGVGKEQPLDTPILTPSGYRLMKDLKIDDKVVGEDGKSYPIVDIFPQGKKRVFELTFNDGTKTKCGIEHLWKIKTIDDVVRDNDWKVVTLNDLLTKYPLKRGKGYNIHIPVNKPVEFSFKPKLPFSPYVMGALLGDGGFTTDRVTFTNPENDILIKMNDHLENWGMWVKHKGTDCQYEFKSNNSRANLLYRAITDLDLQNKDSVNKFIPLEFLLSSVEERITLLRGIFDTDGHVSLNGSLSISTFSNQLCKDIQFLCRSLGIRTTEHLYGEEYRINLLTDRKVFTSLKHVCRKGQCKPPKRPRRYDLMKLVSIEEVEEEECQCIMIDSKDHTYLCNDFIVTHNTWLEIYIGCYNMLQNCRVLQFVTEMSEEIMRDRYEAMLFSMCYGDLNYNHFKSGMLSLQQEKAYFEFLENDLPNFEPLIISTATGVMGVSAEIEKYNPDLILIDGVYLMEDDQGSDSDWLRVAHITRDLKKLAKRSKKPILINTQADKNTSKKTGPELGSISYTQAIGQDCLPKDTLVLTDTGYKRIQYLENEVFKVFDGENYKKAHCTKTGVKKTAVINYRGNELICSHEHKVYVYDNEVKSFVWKKAKDIEPLNDYLLEQNFVTEDGHTHILKYVPRHSNSMAEPLIVPTEATQDLGMIIGMFIGDGSVKPLEKGQVTLSCGQDYPYAKHALSLVKKLFNLLGDIKTIKSSTSGKDELLVTWYSVQFAEWLDFFINDDLHEKTVKLDYIEMCKEFRVGLFAGLIQSDGSCKGQLELTSSRFEVVKGFNMLCKSFGMCTKYDYTSNSHLGKYRVRVMTYDLPKLGANDFLEGYKSAEYYKLFVSESTGRLSKPESYVKDICSKVKPTLDMNSNLYKSVCLGINTGQLSQKYLEQIVDIPYKFMQVEDVTITEYEQEMWNIQVYSEDKRIITNGLVTHNSDDVLAMFRDEIMINDREMCIKVLKQREGTLGKIMMNWDFDIMNFSEIYAESSNQQDMPVKSSSESVQADNTLDIL